MDTLTVERIVREVIASEGSISRAAREAGCSWHTANRYASSTPPLVIPEAIRTIPAPSVPVPLVPVASGVYGARKPYRRILWMSDLHIPYHDPRAVNAVLEFARDWTPDLVVVGGDLYDFYGISRWEKSPARLRETIQLELDAGKPIVQAIDSLGADVDYILGNHEARLASLVGIHPALDGLRAFSWERLAELPTTWRVLPDQARLRVGGLDFLHGNLKGRGGGAKHVAANMLGKLKRSFMCGHWHRKQSYIDPDGDGTPRGGWTNGWLGDVRQADYISCPDWANGAATVEMDPDEDLFGVHQFTIIDGKFIRNGKTYRG